MSQRRIPDLSGLWANSEARFALRFLNINESYQDVLATRIKECAPYTRIKKENGPSIEQIKEALKEINPIIFSESYRQPRRQHRCFGTYETYKLEGYQFNQVCKAIYKMVCLKRVLMRDEIQKIAYCSNKNWSEVVTYINRVLPQSEPVDPFDYEPIEEIPNVEEISMQEIERVRRNVENRRIPDLMYEPAPAEIEEISEMRRPDWADQMLIQHQSLNNPRNRAERRQHLQPENYIERADRESSPLISEEQQIVNQARTLRLINYSSVYQRGLEAIAERNLREQMQTADGMTLYPPGITIEERGPANRGIGGNTGYEIVSDMGNGMYEVSTPIAISQTSAPNGLLYDTTVQPVNVSTWESIVVPPLAITEDNHDTENNDEDNFFHNDVL